MLGVIFVSLLRVTAAAMLLPPPPLRACLSDVDHAAQALLAELKEKKQHMQAEIDNSMTVKLHKMAYEIDFDAY